MKSVSHGSWNRALGWALLVGGFAGAAALDPWSLSQRDPGEVVGSPRMAARHAQAVVVGMAFLQIIVSEVLATGLLSTGAARAASWLTGLGSTLYCAGYLMLGHWPPGVWLAALGAGLNLAGMAILAAGATLPGRPEQRGILFIFCLGMLLDVGMGLSAAAPDRSWVGWLGPEDGLRLRLLRLARAAVIALSVLTWLYRGLRDRAPPQEQDLVRWGGQAMLFGAVAMPLTLILTASTSFHLKYLLTLPAQAVFLASLLAAYLAWQRQTRLELWGWLLVVGGTGSGLLMGLYAFDGPLPDPRFIGAYNDFPRRLLRLSHGYAIVLGLAAILLARGRGTVYPAGWPARFGVPLFVIASVTTLSGMTLVAVLDLPVSLLAAGPALVVVAVCLLLPA